jgi:hypothetical protein
VWAVVAEAGAHDDFVCRRPQEASHTEANDAPLRSRTDNNVATMDLILGKDISAGLEQIAIGVEKATADSLRE